MSRGFTLIEMVITIILLGIVGLFLGNIAGQAMGIYVDTTAREALIQQGRFLTERMSRELREAVPNSVLVDEDNTCIEFLPITNSAIYSELPSATGRFDFYRLTSKWLKMSVWSCYPEMRRLYWATLHQTQNKSR